MTLKLDKSMYKRFTFGDVIENVANRVDDPSAAGVDRYVGLEHLAPSVMTVRRWGVPSDVSAQKLLFEPGDVIFGRRRAYQRKVARADFKGICSAHALVLRARPEFIDPDFLPVFLSSNYFLDRAISISVGSLSPTVNWRDMKVQQFSLPPLDDQRRIADLLWAIERESLSLAAMLEATAVARLAWMDGQLEALVAKGAVPFERTWTQSPDSGWSAAPVDEQTGRFVLSLAALGPDGYRQGHLKNVPDTPEVREAVLLRGDLLISRANTVDTVGRAGIFSEDRDDVSFPDTMMRLRLRPTVIPAFAEAVLSSGHGRRHMRRTAAGSATSMVKINRASLGRFGFPDVSLDIQQRMLDELAIFTRALETAEEQTIRLRAIRNGISAEIFGGAA